ncbi:hypothetical protein ACNUDN_11730 [Mycobacterium sp. smrl_JER01]|uniref:hypothetical protein n=1 Tax=Mycobacterium sp. smrl_JER01 TaxID=3402633 RepID=UPI003AD18E95
MSTCPQCEKHAGGETDSVGAADNLRFARVVLALLNGAEDALAVIADEVGDCRDCIARLAGAGAGMCAGQMQTIAAFFVAAEEHESQIQLAEEQKWDAIKQRAIQATEQIVLDAADLEKGLT